MIHAFSSVGMQPDDGVHVTINDQSLRLRRGVCWFSVGTSNCQDKDMHGRLVGDLKLPFGCEDELVYFLHLHTVGLVIDW